ncbi:phosphopantetheine-binding protein [Lachnospira pectinoschiza]|uniref:Phosphopantetheine attachment site n=1 Tax=Lachnospira pectinoschiza TaxID=28052 RepID=A0A1G9TAY2_9FIRM|nr:phosphopantetheine-binding protein [Lachnospira pectinoschiza]SDM44830.1 Phosphopantetheine attachment site [Lachnospira pectinoschiza]
MIEEVYKLLKENVEELEDVDLKEDTSLIASGFMDSYEVIKMLEKIEDTFSITINLDELNLEDFEKPKNIAKMIMTKRG